MVFPRRINCTKCLYNNVIELDNPDHSALTFARISRILTSRRNILLRGKKRRFSFPGEGAPPFGNVRSTAAPQRGRGVPGIPSSTLGTLTRVPLPAAAQPHGAQAEAHVTGEGFPGPLASSRIPTWPRQGALT